MKKNNEDYKSNILKERDLTSNNNIKYIKIKSMKDLSCEKEEYPYNKVKSVININNNYLHQTFSFKNKKKNVNSSERNSKINKYKTNCNKKSINKNKSYINKKYIKNKKNTKEKTKENIGCNGLEKRLSTTSINNSYDNNKKSKNNSNKNPYYTMQNFYNQFPKPEPQPKRIINQINNLNDNYINNEKTKLNNIKDDKKMLYLLSNLNLENLYNVFIYNYISFNDLFLLTKGDFTEMKIPIGPRNRIMHFIYEYKKYATIFDFKELSTFLNYYKKVINKPIINDMNNNGLFISTNNINNGPFNCFNSPIINNFLNNQNNEEIKIQKEDIENLKILSKNIINNQKLIKNNNFEKTKDVWVKKHNSLKDYNINLIKLNNNFKETKYNNTTRIREKQFNNCINSSKNDALYISSMKKLGLYKSNHNNSYINSNYNKKSKNKNFKTLSSKNLKNNFVKDENNKQHEKYQNKNYKCNYYKNISLKNSKNSNYLLEKFQNIDKEVIRFQKNYSKIQKSARNIDDRLSYLFISQKNTQKKDNLLYFRNIDSEKENIKNLNYKINYNYQNNF